MSLSRSYRYLLQFLLFGFFVISFVNVKAQNILLPKGQVIDTLLVSDSDESFALYLPSTYKEKELSPIIFIFDPSASGVNGIKPFIDAAEKYNLMLVCSNSSRNGNMEKAFGVVNRLFEEVLNRFSIDPGHMYTAGFSGGSRLAMSVAILTQQINGVIGCGAGMSQYDTAIPNLEQPFNYVGIVGNQDMNYLEMLRYEKLLQNFGLPADIILFEGNHTWPPSAEISRAVDWLQLQNMKMGTTKLDTKRIEEMYQLDYEVAIGYQKRESWLKSSYEYQRILDAYGPYVELDSIQNLLTALKQQKVYKSEERRQKKIAVLEDQLKRPFIDRFSSESKQPVSDFTWWASEINKFRKKYSKNTDEQTKDMIARIEFALSALAYEDAMVSSRVGNLDRAIYGHNVLLILTPDRPFPYYFLAKDYAARSNLQKTVLYLKQALEKGFVHKEYILNTPEFKKFSNSEEFKTLLLSLD